MILIALLIILAALWLGYLHGLNARSETPRTISQMPPDFTRREVARLRAILDTAIVKESADA